MCHVLIHAVLRLGRDLHLGIPGSGLLGQSPAPGGNWNPDRLLRGLPGPGVHRRHARTSSKNLVVEIRYR